MSCLALSAPTNLGLFAAGLKEFENYCFVYRIISKQFKFGDLKDNIACEAVFFKKLEAGISGQNWWFYEPVNALCRPKFLMAYAL